MLRTPLHRILQDAESKINEWRVKPGRACFSFRRFKPNIRDARKNTALYMWKTSRWVLRSSNSWIPHHDACYWCSYAKSESAPSCHLIWIVMLWYRPFRPGFTLIWKVVLVNRPFNPPPPFRHDIRLIVWRKVVWIVVWNAVSTVQSVLVVAYVKICKGLNWIICGKCLLANTFCFCMVTALIEILYGNTLDTSISKIHFKLNDTKCRFISDVYFLYAIIHCWETVLI